VQTGARVARAVVVAAVTAAAGPVPAHRPRRVRVASGGVPALLSDLTTLRLGGAAGRVATASSADDLVSIVRAADAAAEPALIVGGGSNIVVADDGWPGVVVLVRSQGIAVERVDPNTVSVVVQAGVPWDSFVAMSVREGWSGLAAMSGIPGMTGATPIQNVGAYGTEVADVITGGDVPAGTLITEEYLLDLERESFVRLCGQKKTLERIQHMLKKGKPLRN